MTSTELISSNTLSATPSFNQTDELPAGGLDANHFDWQEVWYPIHYVKDLDKTKPTPFTLLDRKLVIWWDKNASVWRVFDDKCPHRLALLSEGRINEQGLIECPYHGWTFSGSGKCEFIPQQREGTNAEESKRACVTSLPTTVCQGLLFTYPGNPENAPKVKVPIIESLEDNSGEWVCIDTFRDLPYDALTLLENVLDASHVPFTHHGTVGNRNNAAPVELELVKSGRQGFTGIWEEGPRKGTLGKQDTLFIAPNFMTHDLTSKQFGRTLTVVYATPISKGKCRLFARFPFQFSSKLPKFFINLTPRWYSHTNQNTILEDDQIFLHYQERFLEEAGGSQNYTKACYLPTKADIYVNGLRQWVNDYDAEPFKDQPLPPPLPKEQLLDRYYSHTVHCGSCSKALANIQRLKMALGILTAIALILTPLAVTYREFLPILTLWILTGISFMSGASWLGLGILEKRFYQGSSLPSRNIQK
ncbi:Pheophorbide a oxygenase [Gloeothece citriformis PCC 7424]|uniref:Pheophorbide a oxygenase n=1 Tax=Gloeothece citriformis (strain PCC 7424) TaxID=65393 RepID=B7KGE0_GLOC7|nr:Rieske 2Fe-2S domain-containing protein [Gloeothece citriformis]ACK70611.1 Pheophorbide a oxygenase [Gloeothece citriformis PCC 7424]